MYSTCEVIKTVKFNKALGGEGQSVIGVSRHCNWLVTGIHSMCTKRPTVATKTINCPNILSTIHHWY